MVNIKANPRILKKKKKKTKSKTQYTLQITKSETQATKSDITKANLKTKTSTEQCSQHCNTSQQSDRASPSPLRRSVSQNNLSSSLEYIASGFGYQRSFTRSDWRSPISHVARLGHVTCSVARRLLYCPSLVAWLAPVLP